MEAKRCRRDHFFDFIFLPGSARGSQVRLAQGDEPSLLRCQRSPRFPGRNSCSEIGRVELDAPCGRKRCGWSRTTQPCSGPLAGLEPEFVSSLLRLRQPRSENSKKTELKSWPGMCFCGICVIGPEQNKREHSRVTSDALLFLFT